MPVVLPNVIIFVVSALCASRIAHCPQIHCLTPADFLDLAYHVYVFGKFEVMNSLAFDFDNFALDAARSIHEIFEEANNSFGRNLVTLTVSQGHHKPLIEYAFIQRG